jgi:hypothetical protein
MPGQASPHGEVNSGGTVVGKEKVKELLEHLVSVLLLATRISQEVRY